MQRPSKEVIKQAKEELEQRRAPYIALQLDYDKYAYFPVEAAAALIECLKEAVIVESPFNDMSVVREPSDDDFRMHFSSHDSLLAHKISQLLNIPKSNVDLSISIEKED